MELRCHLVRLIEEVLVDGEHVSKLIQEYLSDGVIRDLHAQIPLQIVLDEAVFDIERHPIIDKHTCNKFRLIIHEMLTSIRLLQMNPNMN